MRHDRHMDWLNEHLPHQMWAPRGLPGWLRRFPGWAARATSESRFAVELAEWEATLLGRESGLIADLPDGEQRPVLVLPGFGFGDPSTFPMRRVLQAGGYHVVESEIWSNIRCSDRAVDRIADVARRAVVADEGRRLLVVGHSRGGLLGRGLGARHPELIEQVISLGSPLNHEFAFYEVPQPLVSVLRVAHQTDPELRQRQCVTPECSCPYMVASRAPMPADVDLVSIYSKSEGVVDWRACVVPGATNIEVTGSHLGMGVKPATLRLVMELLAQSAHGN